MEIDKIRELVQLMVEHDIARISIRNGENQIELRRGGLATATPSHVVSPVPLVPVAAPAPASPPTSPAPSIEEELVPIASPMVGTFYAKPDANSPPYVTVGSEVTEDTVVCLLEAMKVFNEIKAEVAGTIEKILVSNEEGVDYGQPLYLVRPRQRGR